jgi:transposase
MSTEDLNLPNDVEQLKAMIAQREAVHFDTLAQREAAHFATLAQREALHLATIAEHKQIITRHTQTIAQHVKTITQHTETIVQHEVVIASQHDTIEKQLKKLASLQQQVARLLRRQYGPQKERVDPNQLMLFTVEELEQLVSELEQGKVDSVSMDDGSASADTTAEDSTDEASKSKPKRKGHGRRPIPDSIPRELVIHELTDEERLCPCCGKRRKEIGSDMTEQLEFIPAQLKVLQHHRIKYVCDECEENVAIAPKPPQPIEKGLPGPGLLAFTALSKYGDYQPLYRLEDILSRNGIILRRSTLCDWIASIADLLKPLYSTMCHRVRRSRVIHSDDTGIKMLEPGQCRNCKFWVYVGDEANPFVVYEFSLTREGENPSRFLEGYEGYLQVDAFGGYDALLSERGIIKAGCMAHCRRYWWESIDTDSRRAHEAISYIARLYELETHFENAALKGDALRDARQQHALPILNAFETWLKKERDSVLPKSPIGQAFTYTLNQWQALSRYTEDGALAIDNNIAERMVKLPAIGRKNWLFVGSQSGGDRAAILLSIIASAKLCKVEPWAWLNAVLKELPIRMALANASPDQPPDLSDLLPDAWLKSHPEHRWEIDDIRQEERDRSRQQKSSKRRPQGR